MTRIERHILFYSLALVFILTTPVIIGYALGFAIDPGTRGVERTSGIFIKSKTPRLTLFLDGALAKETSLLSGSALLMDIPAGNHLVRLEKAGYAPWSKRVAATPHRVAEFRDVLLVPHAATITLATSTPAERALLPPAAPTPSSFRIDRHNTLLMRTNGKVVAPHVNSFGEIDGEVFFVDKNGFFARRAENGVIETLGHPGFYLSEKPVRFLKSPADEIVIIDPVGGLYLFDGAAVMVLEGSVKDVAFDTDGEKILFFHDKTIEMLWRAEHSYQPFQKKDTREKIEFDAPVLAARWYHRDDAHIVVLTRDGVYLTEIDGRGGRNTAPLIEGRVDEIFTTPDLPEAIFIKQGKTWMTIRL